MKLLIILIIGMISGIILIIYLCNRVIVNNARGRVFDEADKIPFNKVGILLGTTKYTRFGPINAYYQHRIDAAIHLLQSGKIEYIIVSGDQYKNNFNEPEQMKADLLKRGIDESKIYLDYSGYRTLDSMVRLKKVFGQSNATVISQLFHNERAIYLGDHAGVKAIGYNSIDVEGEIGYETHLREKLARVKVFVDLVINTRPRKLDEAIIIP